MVGRCWLLMVTALASALFAVSARADNYSAALEAENAALRERIDDLERSRAVDGGAGYEGCCGANWFTGECCESTIAAFVTGEGWSDFSDAAWPNNFGNRVGLEATARLGDSDIRGHLGASYGIYDYHGRAIDDSSESQVFVTLGAFHRASGCCGDHWTWGVAIDYLHDDDYGTDFVGVFQSTSMINLAQVRFLAGYMANPCNEFGVWGTVGVVKDEVDTFFFRGEVEAQDQLNAYWRRYWDFGGETLLYTGVADSNAEVSPFLNASRHYSEWVLGVRGIAPLTCNVGLFGGFHYVIPSASGNSDGTPFAGGYLEESWNVSFGLVFVRGCNLPVLPTADNGWFTKRLRGRGVI